MLRMTTLCAIEVHYFVSNTVVKTRPNANLENVGGNVAAQKFQLRTHTLLTKISHGGKLMGFVTP